MKIKLPKINFQKIFDNNKFIIVLSVIIAVIALFVVKVTIDDETGKWIYKVPVKIEMSGTAAEKAGLSVIGEQSQTVNVYVQGKRYIIGNLDVDDLVAIATPTDVTKAGEYELEVTALNKNTNLSFQIDTPSPSKITVRFDTMTTQEFPVSVELGSVAAAEGFIQDTAFAQPESIRVTGPVGDLAKIAKCVAKADISGTLQETTVKKAEIQFYDKDNNRLDFEQYLSYTPQTVDVTVPIYKQTTVPLTFEYTNVPNGFPIDQLSYTMSHTHLTIATPNEASGSISEFSLGSIDFRDIDIGSVITLEVVMPAGYRNIDNVDKVTVQFPKENMSSKSITISDINIANAPNNYRINLISKRITNVKIIGPKSIVDSITAADVVATVDLLGTTITKNRFTVPVKITIPNKGLVWATGKYNVVIEAKDK